MGFSDIHNVSLIPESSTAVNSRLISKDETDAESTNEVKLSDQELLESISAIYFTNNVDTGLYELKVCK